MSKTLHETEDAPAAPALINRRAGVAGLLAAAAALATAELMHGIFPSVPSLVVSVGEAVIDRVPTWLKDFAISAFGSADKPVLVLGIIAVALAAGAGIGVLGRRNFPAAAAALGAFGVLGFVTAQSAPGSSAPLILLTVVLAVAAGVLALRYLLDALAQESVADTGDLALRADRRSFLTTAGAVAVLAALGGGIGRLLLARHPQSDAEGGALFDAALENPTTAPAGADAGGAASEAEAGFAIDGLAPVITPVEDFYLIDTALSPPRVDLATWTLRVTGMVGQELDFSYEDLLAMPQMEADITLSCVSNEVGGYLISTGRWTGVRLADVLEQADVDPAATQLVGRSVDDWTAGFPTEIAVDGRDAMIALGLNGEALPVKHGFPARLVIPGLYGYVSATKWLSQIELTTWEAFDGYWVPRGWSKEGPIKTESRIDVPRNGDRLEAGTTPIAGVAWAVHRGINRVEAQIDDGPWQEAELAPALSIDTWIQWKLAWDAPAGEHVIRVRATDVQPGQTQTSDEAPPAPDGATGWHTIEVRVG